MTQIQDLRREIRDLIQHPHHLAPLLADTPEWNTLTSAIDTVSDSEHEIRKYETTPAEEESGSLRLVIYGILQALYDQQTAVESLVRAFEPNAQRSYRIEDEPEAAEIRKVRNRAIGRATREGDVLKSTNGERASFQIVQRSIRKTGFTLMITSADGHHSLMEVSIRTLIEKNRTMVTRILQRIKDKLSSAESKHRKQFRAENLAEIFPETLDYYLEKILTGADSPASGDGQWGKIHLEIVAARLQDFRSAMERRGLLSPAGNYESSLKEVEYPLAELQQYYEGAGALKDSRAAAIFAYFIREKVRKLKEMAVQLDTEYQKQLPAPVQSSN